MEATLRAIRKHGARVGMDEIAAEAGTSKTVLYRHFQDKAGLYAAVVASVDERILRDLTAATGIGAAGASPSPEALMGSVVDTYLQLVERDPEVYRFVVVRPLLDPTMEHRPAMPTTGSSEGPADAVAGITGRIGDHVAALVGAQLQRVGHDPAPAQAWGHGLVGLVRAVADHWVDEADPVPRAELVRQVTELACGGLTAALAAPIDQTTQPVQPTQ